jgi:hypothetical protein
MTDTNEGTTSAATEAPLTTGTPPATPDEVTTLRSRNAGLDAKVTELMNAHKQALADAEAARVRLTEYESGKVGADEALRAQIAAKDAELSSVRKEAQVARISAKYPETFGVLGEAVVGLTEDQLAASEARMAGVAALTETPVPMGTNPARTQAATPKSIDEMTAAELKVHLKTFDPSVMFAQRD